MQIELALNPAPEDDKAVLDGLIAFNEAKGGPSGYQPVSIFVRDDDGKTIGGLVARIGYDWMFVELLHLPETVRRQGFGTQLMQQAEAFARQRGLAGIWLDTYSFQARGFYEKLGYSVFGTLEGHPIGGNRFFLQKRFGVPSTTT
ncbi:MAG: GNAT family N-acetyltransferase [Hyphomicrobiales bacterium]|nr:MAG: GNAT family N-acetyltransferase [Hyphomicrobiales bacterium]